MKPLVARLGLGLVLSAAAAIVLVTVAVERESDFAHEDLGGAGPGRALVLYHPSRDARFSDELSSAVARGFRRAGLAVERATLTTRTQARADGYAIVAVVSNTYFWTPDRPTLRFLRRARFDAIPVIGLMGGAGATGRSERLLHEALGRTGALSVETRSFWLWRPNDEARAEVPNREMAVERAEAFAYEAALAAASHDE
ncbi:MAG: hypothetical protein AB7T31_01100 [Gemmatimonadales bacterium]